MAQQGYEGIGFKERMKEFRTLFVFILVSATISIIVMNILAFPFALFAVKGSAAYTLMVKILILITFISYIIFRIIRRVRQSREDGIAIGSAVAASVSRKGRSVSSVVMIIIFSILLFGILYLLLKYNYIILYELSQ